jgi:ribonuclease D
LTSQIELLNKNLADSKKEIIELKEKSDKDRTLFAQEQQNRRIQEQKLFQALDSLARIKKQKNTSEEEMKAEYEGIKESMEKIQEKVERVRELEDSINEKDEEILQLKRKCKNFEREISLLQDELNL